MDHFAFAEVMRAIQLALVCFPHLTPVGFRPATLGPENMQSWTSPEVIRQVWTAISFLAEEGLEASKGSSVYSAKHVIQRWGRDAGLAPYLLEGPVVAAMIYFGIAVKPDEDGFALMA